MPVLVSCGSAVLQFCLLLALSALPVTCCRPDLKVPCPGREEWKHTVIGHHPPDKGDDRTATTTTSIYAISSGTRRRLELLLAHIGTARHPAHSPKLRIARTTYAAGTLARTHGRIDAAGTSPFPQCQIQMPPVPVLDPDLARLAFCCSCIARTPRLRRVCRFASIHDQSTNHKSMYQ